MSDLLQRGQPDIKLVGSRALDGDHGGQLDASAVCQLLLGHERLLLGTKPADAFAYGLARTASDRADILTDAALPGHAVLPIPQ